MDFEYKQSGGTCERCGADAPFAIIGGVKHNHLCEQCNAKLPRATMNPLASRISEEERVERLLIAAGFTTRELWQTFDTFSVYNQAQKAVIEHCRSYSEAITGGSWLCLIGPCGTGKDHLSSSICRDAAERRQVNRVISGSERGIMARFRALAYESTLTEERALCRYSEADLLIIRDAGIRMGPGERALLIEILDRRYAAMRPVIFTTNTEPGELADALDERIFDRLQEMALPFRGKCYVPCTWESYRTIR